ncbi:hypothetical protein BDK92_7005 [Micromonospora pisi]|uniref:Uncharacterized protein n=1 Tax=Micromonospora pisi TaxID=589240 RepID=A0A495JWC5_9ACTN|nr:hypothetical protein BDK92_7005 [Micromonospora pisi]
MVVIVRPVTGPTPARSGRPRTTVAGAVLGSPLAPTRSGRSR